MNYQITKINKTDLKEKLLTSFVFTGIFLPVRLFFYTYVTTWWLGSFGLITGIMLTILYFSRKNKLGWLGRIVNKQVSRLAKSKAGIFSLCIGVFLLISLANMLYGMSNPTQTTVKELEQVLEDEGVTNLESYTARAKDVRFDLLDFVLGVPVVLYIMVVPTEPGYALFSIFNGWTNNWMQHFMTVWFVQEIEIVGLVIYFRYFYKPNVVLSDH